MEDPAAFRAAREATGPAAVSLWSVLRGRRADPYERWTRIRQEHGEVARYRYAGSDSYLISSAEGVKRVLQDNAANYTKEHASYKMLRRLFGNGLFTSEGSFWLRQRRLAQPAFHRQRLAAMGVEMAAAAREAADQWAAHAASGQPLSLLHEMSKLTLKIVGDALLGGGLAAKAAAVSGAWEVLNTQLVERFSSMRLIPPILPTRYDRAFRRARRTLFGVVDEIIAARRAGSDADDLLSLFMHARDEDTGERMTDGQLRDEVVTMLLAGHETTAVTLTWAWALLDTHPSAAARLRSELDGVLGGRAPGAADLPQLPYTRAVVAETLRHYGYGWESLLLETGFLWIFLCPVRALARLVEQDIIVFHKIMLRELKTFDVSLRTAYAQAKDLALAQARVSLTTPGSLQIEPRGERRFVYRYRYDVSGHRVTDYLGPEDDEATVAKVGEATAEIREAETLTEYSRDLRRLGFYSADNSTVVTVASLFNSGIFAGGGVLVGTHAFGVLLNDLGIRAAPFPMTEDVDLARAGRIQIAALPRGGLLALLRDTGLPFHEVPQLKRNKPATSFKVRGKKLKVDLLVPSKGKPYDAIDVPELGAHATGLPHFRYLLEEPTHSILLGRDRIVPVLVPHAGRFCLHKLAVYALRSDGAKREKDVAQAALLTVALAESHDFLLADAVKAVDRALRSKMRAGAQRALELLGGAYPAATAQLEVLV